MVDMLFKAKTASLVVSDSSSLIRSKATLVLNERAKCELEPNSKLVMGEQSRLQLDSNSEIKLGENASLYIMYGSNIRIQKNTTIEINAGSSISLFGEMNIRSTQTQEEPVEEDNHKPKDFNTTLKYLPTDLKINILKMTDFPKVRDPFFERSIIPLIAVEGCIRRLNKLKQTTVFGLRFQFRHSANRPGNFDVYFDGVQYMNIHVDRNHIQNGEGSVIRHYDYEWFTLEHFMNNIIEEKFREISIEHRQSYDVFPRLERSFQHEDIGLPFYRNPLI